MRMSAEDTIPVGQTAPVMAETATGTAAATTPAGDVVKGVDGSSVSLQPAAPALEEKLQGKELLEALKKQVCLFLVIGRLCNPIAWDASDALTRSHEGQPPRSVP